MARIESLSILLDPTGQEFLQELYDGVIDNIQKRGISFLLKNKELSGDPEAGSVEAKRFANAKSDSYGTARTGGAGKKIKAKPVNVAINIDQEIVEEIEAKDIKLYGVDGLLERRARNHEKTLIRELERAFFVEAANNSTAISTIETDSAKILEALIQQLETTQNEYVDGVDRDMLSVVMNTSEYGKIRDFLDRDVNNSNVDTAAEEFGIFHGVKVYSSIYLPSNTKTIAMIEGAVAQPALIRPYKPERIQLSEAYAVSMFYYYGTKAVTPDLICKVPA